MTEDTSAPKKAQAFILKSQAGHWIFDVQLDGESLGGGGGYADQYEALEAAQDAFPHLELQAVITPEVDK